MVKIKHLHELASWKEEKRSAYLYRIISDSESGTPRQMLFLELAQAAERQAELWANEVRKIGGGLPQSYEPELRVRLVARLVHWAGPRALRPILAAMKVRGMSLYTHAGLGHSIPGALTEVGRRHRNIGGNNLRATVFGMNDGLISNASLILGVAGAVSDNGVILLSGVAGLLAGAFSMAAGEYVSVRSQREMYEYQIGVERDELAQYPAEEAAELALIFKARGMGTEEAKRAAEALISDPERALDTLAREELGLNPEDLGSPWQAAAFSFASFSLGAGVPLLPFLFIYGAASLKIAIALTGLALFAAGSAISLFTGRHAWLGGLRMLAIGAAAGGATYLIGWALGYALS